MNTLLLLLLALPAWCSSLGHAALSGPPPRQETADPAAAFEADLTFVRTQMERQRWKQARALLFELLETHRASPLLRTRWPELENLQVQIAFWSEHERPTADDVIEGDLLSYSESSGKIKIKYRRKNGHEAPWDFEVYEEMWVHPVPFSGPYRLRVKGTPTAARRLLLIGCFEPSGAAFVGSLRNSPSSSLASVSRGARTRWLDNSTDMFPLDRWFEIDVQTRKISIRANNRTVLSGPKPKDLWGRAGFWGFSEVDECELIGTVEPSWIEGRIDQLLQTRRREFEQRYDVLDELPDWLATELGDVDEPELEAPGEDHPRHAEHLGRAEELLADGGPEALLKYANGLHSSRVTTPLRNWLIARAYAAQGNRKFASARCALVLEEDPDFFPARLLLVALELGSHSTEHALVTLEELVAEHPAEPRATDLLARFLLAHGRPEQAGAAVREAIERGGPPRAFQLVQELITRATRGPDWVRASEWKTPHYVIRSDLDDKLCFEAAQILEESYRKWNIHLRRVATPPDFRYRVYLFSGQSGYLSYAADVLGRAPENTLGVFSPTLKQLLVWNAPERETMLRTIRHEGFHQYFDALVDTSPTWLNEGLAEYYETTALVRGRWKDGGLIAGHVDKLRRSQPIPLAEFLEQEHARFYDDPALTYAQAWAFVHFLFHSGPDLRKRLDACIDALAEGLGTEAALERLGDPAELEPLFLEYVRSLK